VNKKISDSYRIDPVLNEKFKRFAESVQAKAPQVQQAHVYGAAFIALMEATPEQLFELVGKAMKYDALALHPTSKAAAGAMIDEAEKPPSGRGRRPKTRRRSPGATG